MKVLAIDPAPIESAYVLLDPISLKLHQFGMMKNTELISRKDLGFQHINSIPPIELAIERVRGMGQIAGNSLFETSEWVGMFYQAFTGEEKRMIARYEIKCHLCGSVTARDSDVRRKVIEHYQLNYQGVLGGGKIPVIGTIKKPGPLYGVTKDVWQALGVALTYLDQRDVPF